jgi:hypothetical protein
MRAAGISFRGGGVRPPLGGLRGGRGTASPVVSLEAEGCGCTVWWVGDGGELGDGWSRESVGFTRRTYTVGFSPVDGERGGGVLKVTGSRLRRVVIRTGYLAPTVPDHKT